MLTPYLPYPPASGGQIRTFNLLKYLSQNNEITLVCLYKNEEEKKYVRYLEAYCKSIYLCKRAQNPWQPTNILKAVFSTYPFLIVRNFSPEAARILKQLLRKKSFDVIHAETFYVMPHLPETPIPFVLVEQTIEFKVYQHFVNSLSFFIRPFFLLDIAKLKYWERYYWKKAQVVGTVSEADRRVIKELEPKLNPVIIPNGAGDEMYISKIPPKNLKDQKLLFVGNFYWLQNTEAANYLIERIFPKLKQEFPDIKVVIAGQNATGKIKKRKRDINIIDIKTDDVAKIKSLYRQATMFIAPIFGPGGTRLKLLASMASGLPIISTKTGIQGLDLEDKIHVLIANTPDEFIEKIKLAFKNKKIYDTIRTNAHKLVAEKYNWQVISNQLEIVYRKITKS
jgi:glycosyltransferase involved in cell wall biosynthesis